MRLQVTITEIIIALIGLVFSAVLIPLAKATFAWLKTKTKNVIVLAALNEAERIAERTVTSLQQTVVEGLKAKHEDGKLTPDEARDVLQMATHQFYMDISDEALAVLTDHATDINDYIRNLIEAKVATTKCP